MTFWNFVCKCVAGLGIFEYGLYANDLEVLGLGWRLVIGIAIWLIYYMLLDVAEILK